MVNAETCTSNVGATKSNIENIYHMTWVVHTQCDLLKVDRVSVKISEFEYT